MVKLIYVDVSYYRSFRSYQDVITEGLDESNRVTWLPEAVDVHPVKLSD